MKKAAGVAPVLVSILLLAGCGGGGSEAAGPEPTGASATVAAPSESPVPSAEPATGHGVEGEQLTVRLPEGYARAESLYGFGWIAHAPGGDTFSLGETDSVPISARVVAREVSRDAAWGGVAPRRGEDVVVDGVTMVHLHGPNGLGRYDDSYAAFVGGQLVELRFSQGGRAAVREQVVASVLATVDWRD